MHKKLSYHVMVAIAILIFSTATYAQVKMGDNRTTINGGSLLELESTNKGLLLPRVALSATNVWGLGGTAAAGMTVYNTATAGTSPNNVVPGHYYHNGTAWVRLIDAGSVNTVVGLLQSATSVLGTTQTSIAAGVTSDITGATVTITPTVNVRVVITTSALPLPNAASAPVQGSIDLVQNGTKIASQYYSATDAPSSLVRLGNYSTITRMVDLTPGTYTFKLQAKSWFNTTLFNVDPVAGSYVGATGIDASAMKASISVMVYTR